jgi:hypothetical protein
VVVYGPAHDEHKESCLAELVNMCSHKNLPLVMGGNYNILRHLWEKNNDRYQNRWSFLFNVVIDGLNLKELQISDKKCTWTNNLANPTFKKLDRVQITMEWEEKFPLTTVQAHTRQVSDHTHLLLNSGESSLMATQHMFKFELRWLLKDGFMEMVRDIWTNTLVGSTPIKRWQGKIRTLR